MNFTESGKSLSTIKFRDICISTSAFSAAKRSIQEGYAVQHTYGNGSGKAVHNQIRAVPGYAGTTSGMRDSQLFLLFPLCSLLLVFLHSLIWMVLPCLLLPLRSHNSRHQKAAGRQITGTGRSCSCYSHFTLSLFNPPVT